MLRILLDDLPGSDDFLDLCSAQPASDTPPRTMDGLAVPPLRDCLGNGGQLLIEW
jgi:hypothetical protein